MVPNRHDSYESYLDLQNNAPTATQQVDSITLGRSNSGDEASETGEDTIGQKAYEKLKKNTLVKFEVKEEEGIQKSTKKTLAKKQTSSAGS